MCRYCERLDQDSRILFGDGIIEIEINASMKKLEVHYNGTFECADFDYEDGFDINYCPICGRKL